MDKNQILGIIRHILTFFSGFIVARGYISEEIALEVVGALMTLAGMAWSIKEKVDRKKEQ